MSAELRTLSIRGLNTSWLESGAGLEKIMILLHGYPDGPEVWDEQEKYFSRSFHVIRPFCRGYLPEERSDEISRYTSTSIALDLLAILKEVDPNSKKMVLVMAHDLGVHPAWRLSHLLKDRLSCLIIFNGLTLSQWVRRFPNLKQQFKSWYIYLMVLPKIPEFILKTFAPSLPLFSSRLNSENPDFFLHTLQLYRGYSTEIFNSIKPQDKLTRPVLVIWGNNDPYLVEPTLDEFERDAREVTIRIIEGKHWIFKKNHKEVNSLIHEFIQKEVGSL